ncbi:MAG: BrnT family toxin [Kiritimatiellaceae bacterium]|nr:BrnT family toxin [Kiritimatiellaceae bacterium]
MQHEFSQMTGFEWDDGNRDKNRLKHKVSNGECEEVFFNQPLIILEDNAHSQNEARYAAYGVTDDGRRLMICFTVRKTKIRVISARDMHKKERQFYENQS